MELEVGKKYLVRLPDGTSEAITVLSDKGNGWYKVKKFNDEVIFLNVNQLVTIEEGWG